MWFEEHEKKIYRYPGGQEVYDPLRLERLLVFHSGGELYNWMADRNSETLDSGDVSEGGRKTKAVASAQAELNLADAARKAFDFPQFPEMLDAEVLERLYHFLEYMEGKGETAGTPHGSEGSSPTSSAPEPTGTTWG